MGQAVLDHHGNRQLHPILFIELIREVITFIDQDSSYEPLYRETMMNIRDITMM